MGLFEAIQSHKVIFYNLSSINLEGSLPEQRVLLVNIHDFEVAVRGQNFFQVVIEVVSGRISDQVLTLVAVYAFLDTWHFEVAVAISNILWRYIAVEG